MQGINFSVGGEKLAGKLFLPDNLKSKNPAALLIHGWESKQDRGFMLAHALMHRGFICMTFDLRGHGDSEGDIQKYSRKDFLDDVIVAYDFLVKTSGIDSENITVIGSSFGSYLAAVLSAKRKIKSLVLRVPSNYRDEGFEEPQHGARTTPEHMEWMQTVQDYRETKALRAVHDFKGEVLLVESANDELVPSTVIQSYANAMRNKGALTHVVMQGAPHSLTKDVPRQKEYTNIVLNWLKPIKSIK